MISNTLSRRLLAASLAFVVLAGAQLRAQVLTAHRGTVESSYNFWFYDPGKSAAPAPKDTLAAAADSLAARADTLGKPLVVFLHGRSLCGNDLTKVLRYGTVDALNKGLRIDAYVIAPQNPGEAWNPVKVKRLMDWSASHYDVDTTRVYVLGMSLGGYGTMDVAIDYPDNVAAAMALCGGATRKAVTNMCRVPMAILHGTSDAAVPVSCSQVVVDEMAAKGDTTRLLWYPLQGRSHSDLAKYFYLPETYEWLFRHSLRDEGRPVDKSFDFSYSCVTNVYRRLTNKGGIVVRNVSKAASQAPKQQVVSAPASATATPSTGVHIIAKGESLTTIARKYHTTIKRLCELNGITNPDRINEGQKIKY